MSENIFMGVLLVLACGVGLFHGFLAGIIYALHRIKGGAK